MSHFQESFLLLSLEARSVLIVALLRQRRVFRRKRPRRLWRMRASWITHRWKTRWSSWPPCSRPSSPSTCTGHRTRSHLHRMQRYVLLFVVHCMYSLESGLQYSENQQFSCALSVAGTYELMKRRAYVLVEKAICWSVKTQNSEPHAIRQQTCDLTSAGVLAGGGSVRGGRGPRDVEDRCCRRRRGAGRRVRRQFNMHYFRFVVRKPECWKLPIFISKSRLWYQSVYIIAFMLEDPLLCVNRFPGESTLANHLANQP